MSPSSNADLDLDRDLESCRAAVREAINRVVDRVADARVIMPYLAAQQFSDAEIEALLSYARMCGVNCNAVSAEAVLIRVPVEGPLGSIVVRTRRVLTAAGFLAVCERTGMWRPGTHRVYRGRTGDLHATARCYGCHQGQWLPVDATICYGDWYDRDVSLPTDPLPPPSPGRWVTHPAMQLALIAQVQAARAALGDRVSQHATVCDRPMRDLHALTKRYRQQQTAPTRPLR